MGGKQRGLSRGILLMGLLLLLGGCGEDAGSPEGNMPAEDAWKESPPLAVENPEEENLADLLQQAAGGAMVRIACGATSGSGVLWEIRGEDRERQELVIVTAGHVLTEADGEIQITFIDGWSLTADRTMVMEGPDLAFVGVEADRIPREHRESCLLARRSGEDGAQPQSGDRIILMASGTGVAADACEGTLLEPWIYVEDFGQDMMLVRADARPGMSGGGVFDVQGGLLGILCGADEDGEAAVLPVSVVSAFSENF